MPNRRLCDVWSTAFDDWNFGLIQNNSLTNKESNAMTISFNADLFDFVSRNGKWGLLEPWRYWETITANKIPGSELDKRAESEYNPSFVKPKFAKVLDNGFRTDPHYLWHNLGRIERQKYFIDPNLMTDNVIMNIQAKTDKTKEFESFIDKYNVDLIHNFDYGQLRWINTMLEDIQKSVKSALNYYIEQEKNPFWEKPAFFIKNSITGEKKLMDEFEFIKYRVP